MKCCLILIMLGVVIACNEHKDTVSIAPLEEGATAAKVEVRGFDPKELTDCAKHKMPIVIFSKADQMFKFCDEGTWVEANLPPKELTIAVGHEAAKGDGRHEDAEGEEPAVEGADAAKAGSDTLYCRKVSSGAFHCARP